MTPRQDNGVTLQGTGADPACDRGRLDQERGHRARQRRPQRHNQRLRDQGSPLAASPQGYAAGIVSQNTANDTIQNNVIHGSHGHGIYAYGIMLGTNASPASCTTSTCATTTSTTSAPAWRIDGHLAADDDRHDRRAQRGVSRAQGGDPRLVRPQQHVHQQPPIPELDGDHARGRGWRPGQQQRRLRQRVGLRPQARLESTSLTMWHLSTGQWSRFWHNTSYGNTHADMALGMNRRPRTTSMSATTSSRVPATSTCTTSPASEARTSSSTTTSIPEPRRSTTATWNSPHPDTYTTLTALQAALGWEMHGQVFTPQFWRSDLRRLRLQPVRARARRLAAGCLRIQFGRGERQASRRRQ